ncbi:N-acetylmuramoyl-L-alanine amidase [Streptomyces yaanensis]|uniref:N-acetylmuramoyl-L-alanine amidase n=1 Tax=Streptomyces yaanensis TaxID=1142239 RepID=A0ABV7S8E1_9ACTN|nr:N-acetylmuramoyl-L-alanine amidase [Streptomyces sp. CGMCC 4.7035]WNC02684.1 N-acetylmuramoyl-L-alanine amidase [Streptomyces sp. CGMCC 4.7035]
MALGAVVAGGGVAVVAVGAAGSSGSAGASDVAEPIKTHVHSLPLTGAASLKELGARSTTPFSMVGVTWTGAKAKLRGTVEVRTRSAVSGDWTKWLQMQQPDAIPDAAEQNRPGVRGGMAPLWSGPSNGIQVRATGSHKATALPAGLRVDLIDPGKAAAGTKGKSGSGMGLAGFAMDGTATDSATPVDSGTATPPDSGTATDTASATATATDSTGTPDSTPPTDSSSPTGTTSTPTATASDSASASPGASDSTSPSPSTSAWPSQLPTTAEAYPSCSSTASASPAPPNPMPASTTSTVAPPKVVTRAGWGADECDRETGYPSYGSSVKVMFVHHTDTPNNYACSDSPAIVRSLYAAHLSQGWRDLGYNFLVDKCGTIFEGRFGGMALPVVGAQTYGFNTNSMGVAAIGTYTDLSGGDSQESPYTGAAPSTALLSSIARIAAWKFGMTGVNPATGTAYLPEGASNSSGFTLGTNYKFNVISGHRNGFATDCPGNQLYAALGTIRSYAAGPVSAVTVTGMSGGAVKSGTSYYTKGSATVSWTTSTPSTVISGFDVLVDGKAVAHASGTARSASISVAAGSHTVQVRATHVRGSTTLSDGATLVGDTTAPTFSTAPAMTTRTGTVNSTAVPVSVTWKAADNAALAKVLGTAPSSATFGPTVASWSATAKPGASALFSLKAYDVAGNTRSGSVYGTPNIIQETSTTRTGAWTRKSSSSYLGGYSYSSSSANASISWTFTGRSVAWVVSRASTSGQAYIYVDGTKVTTVDLKSSTTQYRQAIWTKSWSSSAKHTVKIVVVGTAGRPAITTDGITTIG